ncbi:hypothetical protein FACS1894159_07700 [Bacteroidia bacterium]|nr:hypothetical protein FACS1894159_07700 [Bacteroidia bacterium]
MTKVVFRKWRDGGQVVALFPEEVWSRSDHIASCMHVGQHGGADCDHVVARALPAREPEYAAMLCDLISIGYDDLRVMKRCGPKLKKPQG